ncbi:glycosyltransferase family 2 protein [Hydrocarboniphaga sp.]|uniref:glycosyltransferase family 2 protein n=1 Tax=Hydrocarboniphaga sp. TaxID=2033016 RepID=UPI00261A3987|nr:glycosyltransferase family 2 protein [Hydrocarboniphaga sp.]
MTTAVPNQTGRSLTLDALPTISIVTICRDAAPTLKRAIQSVQACLYPNLEYVVVDGGSTDGTLSIIDRYRGSIDRFVSEPDSGISDAMNKGIRLSTGEYHYLLHADDELDAAALEQLAVHARQRPAVVAGSVRVMAGERLVRIFRPEPAKLKQKMSVPHMGCLVRKDVWAEVGGYDLRRKIAMDHLFMLRIFQRYGLDGFRVVDTMVADYHLGGVSDHRVLEGFAELKDNLLEAGASPLAASLAYYKLVAKSRIGKLIRGS